MTWILSTVKQKTSVTNREFQILQSLGHTQARSIAGIPFQTLRENGLNIGPSWSDQGVIIPRLVKAIE